MESKPTVFTPHFYERKEYGTACTGSIFLFYGPYDTVSSLWAVYGWMMLNKKDRIKLLNACVYVRNNGNMH